MQFEQYTYMFEAEDLHWWYVGNHENFFSILQKKNILKNGIKVLDAGCGTGRWLQILKSAYDISEIGVDNREVALEYAKTRGNLQLVLEDLNNCIFKESTFDLITSFDVIYHLDVDDNLAIKYFNTYLKNEGYLMLTVPAYSFLLSKHDEVVHTNKRYSRKQIKLLLENNGFEIVKLTYCVSLLFPFAFIKRLIENFTNSGKGNHNEVKIPPSFINKTFLFIMRIENYILKYFPFPFGLSVMALARKK